MQQIHIAYLRMSKLAHLPANPLVPAAPLSTGRIHRCARLSNSILNGIEP